MEFRRFAEQAARIEAESADTTISSLVGELLAEADSELPIVTRFIQGRVFPAWSSQTLDIGPALCYEAIAKAAAPNVTAADVEARVAETGDVGAAAASYDLKAQRGLAAFGTEEQQPLTVQTVFEELETLANTQGEGSQATKRELLFGLLNRCSTQESRYLARLVLGEMRIGVGDGTVRDAIIDTFDVEKSAVRRALQVANDYGVVAQTARDDGTSGLREISLELHRPVQAMLAQSGTVTEALDQWEAVAVETKYDGARVQIHYDKEGVGIYSRNMEDVTESLPELVDHVQANCKPPVILDGEVIAIDEDGAPLPFQEILKRFRRKYDIEATREEIKTELQVFDCLHAPAEYEIDAGPTPNQGAAGIDLLDAPYRLRRQYLDAVCDGLAVDVMITDNPSRIENRETAALEAGHEGLMLKNPAAAYTPGRRGKDWLKRKPDVETLDLVVIGAEWGEGRRANVFGTFKLGVCDGDEYRPIGNVATGLTDEQLAELTDRLTPYIRDESGHQLTLEPAVVFEVGYEEIQPSPTYESGYALRFPRFVAVREDKQPAEADSLARVRRLVD